MIATTEGIVLSTMKYSNTSMIVKIFTDQFGLQSYLVKGIRSVKTKIKIGTFQPLHILEMVVYPKQHDKLSYIKEVKCRYQMHAKVVEKQLISLFLGDLLARILIKECDNKSLFAFLNHEIKKFQKIHDFYNAFYLSFLFNLTTHLGFGISDGKHFLAQLPSKLQVMKASDLDVITKLLLQNDKEAASMVIDKPTGKRILNALIEFYSFQIVDIRNMKSLGILKKIDIF